MQFDPPITYSYVSIRGKKFCSVNPVPLVPGVLSVLGFYD